MTAPVEDRDDALPRVVQVALCTSDIPRTVALLSDLGFRDAGGRVFSGPLLAEVQELGDDGATVIWWLVGDQDYLQLELFHHTVPVQRPRPADERVCDLGWSRWTIEVGDLDAATAVFARYGIAPMGPVVTDADSRRACFRDPWTAVPLEVVEMVGRRDDGALGGGRRDPTGPRATPRIVAATVSVPDLERARATFVDLLGMPLVDGALHRAEHEALWGLDGARSRSFAVRGGDAALEVVEYLEPRGRPAPADRLLSDQGFMHAAVGHEDIAPLRRLADRVLAAGHRLTAPLPDGSSGGTYAWCDDVSLELFAVPPEERAAYGFDPEPPPAFG
ncbi:MAG: VOC family protein [Solirubrobacteraceae bacterium]|nr:VOC family protein [Solirubrobacteraceae bacterium]